MSHCYVDVCRRGGNPLARGEAGTARRGYTSLDRGDREALVRFVESL